jgi:hypothetical protein
MNQLVPITNGAEYRQSTDAAGLCREIVKQTAKPIQGRRYVSVEGWQAIAIAHGCTASADNVERVDDEGMSGFKCTGIVRRMSDGAEISRAEGFLGDDEQMWSKRPVYARRAMVQTRAISRACRSAFAHVVVMIDAGLSTTPAEEVPHEGFDDARASFDRPANETVIDMEPASSKIPGITKIKERLRTLQSEGDMAEISLETFNGLIHAAKDDLTKIKDANHGWWTGDGEDFEGFKSWIIRRRAELSETEDGMFKMLIDSMKECDSSQMLANWMATNESLIEQLDGAEGRKFEMALQLHESALKQVGLVGAG